MLQIGYILFGLVGGLTMIIPIILLIATGEWLSLLAFIPAFIVSRIFYTLSGFFKAKQIEKITGLNIKAQSDYWNRY